MTEDKGVSLEEVGLQLCHFITLDSEVFEIFFENDDKLFALFSTVYFSCLTEFLTEYCNRLEQANLGSSLKPNDSGRELILDTWRGRGMKYHADYVKVVEAIFHTVTSKLEETETDSILTSSESTGGILSAWRTQTLRLIRLGPIEDAIVNSLQKWLIAQDEQIIQEMRKNGKVQVQTALLSRLTFAIKELGPFCLIEYQPGGLVFKQNIIASAKQIFWFIKDACQGK